MLTAFLLFLGLVLAVVSCLAWRTRQLAAEARRLVPPAGRFQPVKGGVIHFVESGPKDAPPVLMIHGLSGQLQHFTYALAEALAEDFRCIAIDRPGCGYSTRDGDRCADPATQARMIAAFVEARGIERAVVVGHSLGGAVALALALDHPGKVAALALLAPATHPVGQANVAFTALEIGSPFLRRAVARTVAIPRARATAEAVLAEIFAPETCPDDFATRGGAALGLRPESFIAAASDFMALHKALPALSARYAGELQTPGAVLFGADDPVLPVAEQGRAMTPYGFHCTELSGRGHMIPLTAPQECAEFIRRVAARARG